MCTSIGRHCDDVTTEQSGVPFVCRNKSTKRQRPNGIIAFMEKPSVIIHTHMQTYVFLRNRHYLYAWKEKSALQVSTQLTLVISHHSRLESNGLLRIWEI